jgi:hypothetical protein
MCINDAPLFPSFVHAAAKRIDDTHCAIHSTARRTRLVHLILPVGWGYSGRFGRPVTAELPAMTSDWRMGFSDVRLGRVPLLPANAMTGW